MNLDGHNGGQPLAGIIACRGDFGLAHYAFPFHVEIERSRQGAAEPGQMGTPVALRYVVGETEDIFLVRIVPLHGNLDADRVLVADKIKHLIMQWRLFSVQMLYKGPDSPLVLENVLLVVSLIGKLDPYAGIQK